MGKQPLLKLSQKQRRIIRKKIDQSRNLPIYPYPWQNLEADLADSPPCSLQLFGYGSLINVESAAQTLSNKAKNFAIAIGARRLLNYKMPNNSKKTLRLVLRAMLS